jgi:hypothetical protein
MAQAAGELLARYNAMREAALGDAQERLRARFSARLDIPIRLSLIDEPSLQAWQGQWKPRSDRPGGWNWREQRLALRSTLSRFEVAIWSGPMLCGLAIGRPSKGPSHLAVLLLEGNPSQTHPLTGLVPECVAEAGISYGRLLGKAQLRFLRPLPIPLSAYRRLGFRVEPESLDPLYCFLEI